LKEALAEGKSRREMEMFEKLVCYNVWRRGRTRAKIAFNLKLSARTISPAATAQSKAEPEN